MQRLNYIQQGGNWTDIPDELLPKGMRKARKSDHTKRYGRPMWDGLSSTILTKCDPHWGAFSTLTRTGHLQLEKQRVFNPFLTTMYLQVLRLNNMRR